MHVLLGVEETASSLERTSDRWVLILVLVACALL